MKFINAQWEQSVIFCGTLWHLIAVFALNGLVWPRMFLLLLFTAINMYGLVWPLDGPIWSFMAEYRLFLRSYIQIYLVLLNNQLDQSIPLSFFNFLQFNVFLELYDFQVHCGTAFLRRNSTSDICLHRPSSSAFKDGFHSKRNRITYALN